MSGFQTLVQDAFGDGDFGIDVALSDFYSDAAFRRLSNNYANRDFNV